MTGFGKASENFQSKKITVEIRSLNSKSMDLNTRIPSQYKEIDGEIRKKISKGLGRGKVDLSINIEAIGDSKAISINTELAKKILHRIKVIE